MKRLFADTFFFFAFLSADDIAHQEASAFYDTFDGDLVTTEWILTELASRPLATMSLHPEFPISPAAPLVPR
jgi:predicted nucleic acid-binding protein